jgi:hypothetical protein
MSNLLCVDFIVRPMRSNKANIYDLKLILHGDDQSIAIAFNIEHNPVVSQDAGGAYEYRGSLSISQAVPLAPRSSNPVDCEIFQLSSVRRGSRTKA